jgi:hypothetical protein
MMTPPAIQPINLGSMRRISVRGEGEKTRRNYFGGVIGDPGLVAWRAHENGDSGVHPRAASYASSQSTYAA